MQRYLTILFVLTLVSCQNPDVNADLLFGQWQLEEGFRNGQPSPMLDGIYFQFDEQYNCKSNYLGEEITGTFSIDKSKLLLNTHQESLFRIKELTTKTLILNTNLRGNSFQFRLKKME